MVYSVLLLFCLFQREVVALRGPEGVLMQCLICSPHVTHFFTDIIGEFIDYHGNDSLSEDICFSDLELPSDYDRFKLPIKPIDVNVGFLVRQISQVHEDKLGYDMKLGIWIEWQDKELARQTERAGCNPFVYKGIKPKFWLPGTR